MPGPLAGYRVLDVTTVLLGPYAAMWLADLGADVIKVEAPPAGDSTRHVGPNRHRGMSGPFLQTNRNKRSIALDLKQESGRAALRALVRTADVFLHNMRPSAIGKLGFGYADVAKVKPDIVYCGAYGYSQKGPYAARPAYDDLIQAHAGLAALAQKVDGAPRFAPTVMVDKMVGLTTAMSILAALLHRQRTGEGQAIEVPMFETLAAFLSVEHLYGRVFDPPIGNTGYGRLLTPYRRPYRSKDGFVAILPYTDRHWRGFFDIVGRAELADDPRFADLPARTANIDALYRIVDECAVEKTNVEWLAACQAREIPCAPVTDIEDLPEDEHMRAVGLFQKQAHPTEGDLLLAGVPVTFSASPTDPLRPAPRFGEHGPALLREAGMTEAEIAAMRAAGALLGEES
jgi:crotonobetainyl-CoA:carnitine CoA-transferase CaiB-like acyl-CoA transferase